MGTVGVNLRELLVMLSVFVVSLLALANASHLKALSKRQAAVPVTPGNVPGLVPGSAAAAAWWNAQLIHAGQLAHHVGKRQAANPVTPGNIPGLVPGRCCCCLVECSAYPCWTTCSSCWKETSCQPSDSWKYSRTCSWIRCCCCLVECSACPCWTACSSCWKETSCKPSDPWKHSWACSWICCCCCLVECSTYPRWTTCSSSLINAIDGGKI